MKLLVHTRLSSLPVQTPLITPLAFGAAAPVQQTSFRAKSHFAPRVARARTRLSAQRGGSDEPDEPEEEVAVVKASIFALEALGKELDFFGAFSLNEQEISQACGTRSSLYLDIIT
jgi:hypothetical protein